MIAAESAGEMPLTGHLSELRQRIISSLIAIGLGTAVSLFFIEELIAFLTAPAGHLYFSRPAEVFIIYMKTAVIAGFILPALTDREKSWTCIFVPLSVGLFLGGICFSYFFVMPRSVHFLIGFGGESFTPLLSMENYLEFVLLMIIPFGIVFNLPLVMIALSRAGLVHAKTLKKVRKFVILASFVIAAVITPTPDILTQSLLALPCILLYEVSLRVISLWDRN